jgi:DNA-binding HxlR family transcriptional regulator
VPDLLKPDSAGRTQVKGKRKSFASDVCPIARALDAIGDWWSLLIIRDALAGKRRFGEFQKSLGLAKNILASRLRKLIAQGIVTRVSSVNGTAHEGYVLTEKGKNLHLALMALGQWGHESLFAPGELRGVLCDRQKGQPVARIELRAGDGRVLKAGDTILRFDLPSVKRTRSVLGKPGAETSPRTKPRLDRARNKF